MLWTFCFPVTIEIAVKHKYDRLQAFKTKGPEHTLIIIDNVLETLKEK